MKKTISSMFILLLFLNGCFMHRAVTGDHWDSSVVRSGRLEANINKQAFLDVWGEPTKIQSEPGDMVAEASFGRFSGFNFENKRQIIEIWTYENIGVELYFDKGQLIGWKTDRTVEELKAAAKPKR